DAPVAKADAVLVERLRDDDVVDAGTGEVAALGQIGDAAEAARFLVDGAGDLDGTGMIGTGGDEGLHRDDGGGEAALHVAGAAAIDASVPDDPGERIERPVIAGLDDIDMGIEMDCGTGP